MNRIAMSVTRSLGMLLLTLMPACGAVGSAALVVGEPAARASDPTGFAPLPTAVRINGVQLSATQVAALAATYGVSPTPGAYWYDARSGLFGMMGGPSLGIIRPGHAFGPLSARASRGTTGIFINGRELPASEAMQLAQLVRAVVPPGRYWLDANGNAGPEGSPVAVVNLWQASAQGRGGGGAQRGFTIHDRTGGIEGASDGPNACFTASGRTICNDGNN